MCTFLLTCVQGSGTLLVLSWPCKMDTLSFLSLSTELLIQDSRILLVLSLYLYLYREGKCVPSSCLGLVRWTPCLPCPCRLNSLYRTQGYSWSCPCAWTCTCTCPCDWTPCPRFWNNPCLSCVLCPLLLFLSLLSASSFSYSCDSSYSSYSSSLSLDLLFLLLLLLLLFPRCRTLDSRAWEAEQSGLQSRVSSSTGTRRGTTSRRPYLVTPTICLMLRRWGMT